MADYYVSYGVRDDNVVYFNIRNEDTGQQIILIVGASEDQHGPMTIQLWDSLDKPPHGVGGFIFKDLWDIFYNWERRVLREEAERN